MKDRIELTTNDLKEVVVFAISLGQGIEKSLNDDGKLTLTDLPNFFPTLLKVVPAIEGIENVPFYIKAISQEEAAELITFIKTELDLEDDKAEKFIEDAVRIVLDIWLVVKQYFIKTSTTEEPNTEEAPN